MNRDQLETYCEIVRKIEDDILDEQIEQNAYIAHKRRVHQLQVNVHNSDGNTVAVISTLIEENDHQGLDIDLKVPGQSLVEDLLHVAKHINSILESTL